MPEVEATWEDVDLFQQAYPSFELEDKLYQQEEDNVVDTFVGKTYVRQRAK